MRVRKVAIVLTITYIIWRNNVSLRRFFKGGSLVETAAPDPALERGRITALQTQIDELQASRNALRDECAQAIKQAEEAARAEFTEALNAVRLDVEGLHTEVEALHNTPAPAPVMPVDNSADISALRQEVDSLRTRLKEATTVIDDMRTQQVEFKASLTKPVASAKTPLPGTKLSKPRK